MSELPPNAIAVIGMSCRFPGAPDVATFWANLLGGVESISRFSPGELRDSLTPAARADPAYVAARPIVAGVDMFDAGYFGMYASEAALTDPQQRLFLECAVEALESAGYDPARSGGAIGVIAGASMNTYFLHNVCADRATIDAFTSGFQVQNYQMLLGGGDFIATRTAYKLDLRGPAFSVQTACSTSLVAIAQACQSLLLFQSDMMLAGGASISLPQERGYLHQEGGMVSADGHCRSFDAAASGTVFGDGVGVVLLKRLEEAMADGDAIHAVIRGAAVNNDGARKVGFTAPSIDGQEAVVAEAQALAGVAADTIGYVECHGTATPLGDPIELAALGRAFAAAPAGTCAIGSVKSNIGHLDAAAGVAGFIKTVLALEHGILPASLHFVAPNPRLQLQDSPFHVNASLTTWSGPLPRRAGVSALGVGGTNAHVVLEQAPNAAPDPVAAASALPPQLLVLSARSRPALLRMRARLADHLQAHPEQTLADVAFTLQRGRREWPYRCAVAAASPQEAIARLAEPLPDRPSLGAPPRIAFLFPGQGTQYEAMGRGLYLQQPVFRAALDACATILRKEAGWDLCEVLFGGGAARLSETEYAQPAIFSVSYALALLWRAWGIVPAAMLGHSVGEFVAACVAGVMTVHDALGLVAVRGKLMQALPRGSMLSVRLGEAELAKLLAPESAIAAINAPGLCVAAGPSEQIDALALTLERQDVACRRLRTSHAFHSPMMDAVLPALAAQAAAITLRVPKIPFVSGVTGDWISDAEATDPGYWARHCRAPVRFAAGIARLAAMDDIALTEVGAGHTLATLARQGGIRVQTIAGSLPDAEGAADVNADPLTILAGLGLLWAGGVTPDWAALHAPHARRRVRLPTYPFERERHWIDAPVPITAQAAAEATILPPPDPVIDMQDQAIQPDAGDAHETRLRDAITALLENLSGEALAGTDPNISFVELGFDSLFLGQFAQALGRSMGLTVAFRDLLGGLPSVAALAAHAAAILPPTPQPAVMPQSAAAPPPLPAAGPALVTSSAEALMAAQLQAMQNLFSQQLATLQGISPTANTAGPGAGQAATAPPGAPAAVRAEVPVAMPAPAAALAEEPRSRFAVYKPGAQAAATLTALQQRHLDSLIATTLARTGASRRYTERHRGTLADPRAAAGFNADWKAMVYPIVSGRAAGSRLWDIDDNEYIDLVNGYGQTFLGHAPKIVVDAVAEQLRQGFAIGPQSPLAGEVADLVCELTGHERATFCNTGSEAVMAAMRVARAVTGRERVVVFGGAYHGQFDEVLVKGARSGVPRALPVAPGIPAGSVTNMVVLPYTQDSVAWVRANAHDLAAVMVESVQSRHPAFQPREMLSELRAITAEAGAALVFDEVVTGFRMDPGGMQALFDVRADMATYGKVLGGGMPIGVLAGKAKFMDALDGGPWQYDDDSFPAVAPTFFAGTFVRHPLALAAARAVLLYLKEKGPALQRQLATRTENLVGRLRAAFAERGLAPSLEQYGSLFYLALTDQKLGSLLWYHLRARGIYMQEGFPCFLTTEHGDAEADRTVAAMQDSLDAMLADGMLERTIAPSAPFEVPPTEPQAEVWLAAQTGDAASCAFNEGIQLTLEGTCDIPALASALNQVLARHDALRSVLSPTGEALRVLPTLGIELPVIQSDGEGLSELLAAEATTPFDLINGPLIRARLLALSPVRHVLVLTAHHIVCDGWSINVIVSETAALYAGAPVLAPPLPFSRYAMQQAGAQDEQAIAWWKAAYADPPTPLPLPTDRPRPALKSYRGATTTTRIDAAQATALRKAGGRLGCTMFATLLGALQILLGRLADAQDVVVATPAAGQALVGDQVLVGHCVNLLPMRARWNEDATLADMLKTTQQAVLEAYDHQDCTLGTIVRRLNLPRSPGRIPLTDVQFNLERLAAGPALPGLAMTIDPNPKAYVNFDLFLNIIESAEGLRLDLDYSTDLFDAETVARWLDQFGLVLAAITADPSRQIRTIPLAPAAPARQTRALPAPSADAMVEAMAAAHPHATAIICGGTTLTYAQMQDRINRLAAVLREAAPAPTQRVGIKLRRSADLPVALLAVLRAGLAYVPLDPGQPTPRLRSIVEHAAIGLLVSDDEAPGICPDGVLVLRLDQLDDRLAKAALAVPDAPAPDRPAYVIYTSGSTGAPKGVEIPHGALVNLLAAMAEQPGLGETDRLLAVTTIAFDIAALELLLPLTVGGTTVIADQDQARDGVALQQLIERHGITALQATPSLWRILLEAGFVSRPGLRMLAGGEPLDRALADRLLAGGGMLWNMYGPTETTIWSALDRVMPDAAAISIGRPIANTGLFVLDPQDQPRPIGVIGELCITGAGLALGYVDAPELTAQSFPVLDLGGAPPERVYRTGDLARLLADGRIALLGRRDSQVKLRGYRIELGEIEHALSAQPGIAAAAVLLRREIGGGQLAGYYAAQPAAEITEQGLTQALAARLPDYMVPAIWCPMDALPMTANGKIDRAALPAPQAGGADRPMVLPRTPMELRIAEVWRAVLGMDQVGVTDTLFALGADSIHLFRIAARLMQQGLGLAARDLLAHPTIAEQAEQAERALTQAPPTRPTLAEFVRARRASQAVA